MSDSSVTLTPAQAEELKEIGYTETTVPLRTTLTAPIASMPVEIQIELQRNDFEGRYHLIIAADPFQYRLISELVVLFGGTIIYDLDAHEKSGLGALNLVCIGSPAVYDLPPRHIEWLKADDYLVNHDIDFIRWETIIEQFISLREYHEFFGYLMDSVEHNVKLDVKWTVK